MAENTPTGTTTGTTPAGTTSGSTAQPVPATVTGPGTTGAEVAVRPEAGELSTDQGRTSIADAVVAKIAGIATREVEGVHDLGGGTARAVGAIRERIASKTNLSQGVGVEVGERQAAIDLEIVADYGVAIADVAGDIRRHVIESVESMTGLQVTEVNITVHDVFLGDDTEETTPEPRVE